MNIIIISLLILLVLIAFIVLLKQAKPSDQSGQDVVMLRGQIQQLTDAMAQQFSTVQKNMADSLMNNQARTADAMSKLHERLGLIDKAQKNLENLSVEVNDFKSLLSNKQSRGAFGEIQMNDLISQMLPPNAYEFQATLSNGKRADCLIKLPNPPGSIVVDSKFPLESYQSLVKASTETEKIQAERFFRDSVQKHIKDISEKYVGTEDTADSAILFLPSEAIYAELYANFDNLVQFSFKHRVWITSPTTLMATLQTMRAVLKDAKIKEQTKIIQKELAMLTDDMMRLDGRVQKLATHFRQANEDVIGITTSTAKITKRAQKIEAMEVEEQAPTLIPEQGD